MQPRHTLVLLSTLLLGVGATAQPYSCQNGSVVHAGEIFACSSVDLLARISLEAMGTSPPPFGNGNDSWGWTDLLTGREYALMGLDNGTFFIDITLPENPMLLGKLPTTNEPSLWRDMKVYNDHMFVVSEAPGHGMQVFDLTQLRGAGHEPTRTFAPTTVFTGGAGPTFFRAHNIAINEDTGYAYVVGARDQFGRVCAGGLYMIDISDPVNPQFAGCFSQDGYTHDAQCVVYAGPDLQYFGHEICFASNENTVTIVDVTNKDAPLLISHGTYPQTGYTHQGWLSEDHAYFFVNDELDEVHFGIETRTVILDVFSLSAPAYAGSYFHGTTAITHNLFIREDYLFAANYTSGLRILDIRGFLATGAVDSIVTKGYFDTHPDTAARSGSAPRHDGDLTFNGAWSNYPYFASGNVLISDMNRGLFVVRPTNLGISTEPGEPSSAARLDVFPNPVAERLTLRLSIGREQQVRAELFDIMGRRVAGLLDQRLAAGNDQEMTFSLGAHAPGMYLLRVIGEDFALSHPLVRVR